MRSRSRRARRSGFTLIEVLLVLVILVILASLVGFYVQGAQKRALADAAKTQIGRLKLCVDAYMVDVRTYPSTSQGLNALVSPPSDLPNQTRWRGPYLEGKNVPLDSWDQPYQYQMIDGGNYRIWSVGPDGSDGTADDISSNNL
ncbi:MAG: type II secretion system major pseudopilin GspG [Planctomycetota bacterium]